MKNHLLEIEQGIPFEQGFLVRNENLSPKDLSGFNARMHFRIAYSSLKVELESSTYNGRISIIGSTVYLNLSEEETRNLKYAEYYYDLELLDASDEPVRLLEGKVQVSPEVTR